MKPRPQKKHRTWEQYRKRDKQVIKIVSYPEMMRLYDNSIIAGKKSTFYKVFAK